MIPYIQAAGKLNNLIRSDVQSFITGLIITSRGTQRCVVKIYYQLPAKEFRTDCHFIQIKLQIFNFDTVFQQICCHLYISLPMSVRDNDRQFQPYHQCYNLSLRDIFCQNCGKLASVEQLFEILKYLLLKITQAFCVKPFEKMSGVLRPIFKKMSLGALDREEQLGNTTFPPSYLVAMFLVRQCEVTSGYLLLGC